MWHCGAYEMLLFPIKPICFFFPVKIRHDRLIVTRQSDMSPIPRGDINQTNSGPSLCYI